MSFNVIPYNIEVYFDDTPSKCYNLRNQGTRSRPKALGTVKLWYGCQPGSKCGHVSVATRSDSAQPQSWKWPLLSRLLCMTTATILTLTHLLQLRRNIQNQLRPWP